MYILKKLIFVSLISLTASNAWSDLNSEFAAMESNNKGPFGMNVLQGTKGQATIQGGGAPGGSLLFQAAYRNSDAQQLIIDYSFYTGNLFTTNYYELMGEYVYGAYANATLTGSFSLDHQSLLNQGVAALPKTSNMVRHWVVEKYYLTKYIDSGLSKGFSRRGISGSEFEQAFAAYFFDFYMSLATDPFDYLAGYQLAKNSPIVDSAQLAKARNLISESYDYFVGVWGSGDSRVRDLYKIRNAIHNQLSRSIIGQIDNFLAANPWYVKDGHTYLGIIRSILVDYFNADPSQIVKLAKQVGPDAIGVEQDATVLVNGTVEHILALKNLSDSLVGLRNKVVGVDGMAFETKAKAIALIVYVTDYLGKELLNHGTIERTESALVALNCMYAEGLIIPDNYDFIKTTIEGASLEEARNMLAMTLEVGSQTLNEVFAPTVNLWVEASGKPELNQFFDDTVKSSTMNTVSVLLQNPIQ